MRDNELEMRLRSHGENMKQSMDAPFDITEKINEMEKCDMTEKKKSFGWLKKTAYGALATAAAFVLVFNCFPSLAYAANDIPVLGAVVRVVTFGRFEIKKENVDVTVVTPEVKGLQNKELEDKLNREFSENADAIIHALEEDIKKMSEEYGDNFYLGFDADYTVRTDNDNILAIDFYMTSIEASASTTHKFYNIDKKSGKLIELRDLFKKDADYITVISKYILRKMKKQNENGTGYFNINEEDVDKFEKIKENQNFFINDKGNIVISFDEYEVATGAAGSPEFEIPREVVKDIIR